ncbi:hypothetical protein BDN71DRAFT_1498205 [Pleurotus eryngii]|uniref:Uncharacterized protein n=1 Tax=Pleurotus eryngii TaxID=5323 RepID=A0A9P6DBW1_PLEER|nr:hypothetical protein BDN71DRAFT_1498205 [Pleurotus eryngii]
MSVSAEEHSINKSHEVENVLFTVDLGVLQEYSEVLQAIFSIPPAGSLPVQGTKENPIDLHGVLKSEMEAFLDWQTHLAWTPVTMGEDKLVALLKISDMWQIHGATKWAMHHIEQLGLSAPRMMQLGLKFHIKKWVADSMSTLLSTPLHNYELLDLEMIGLPVVYVLIRTQSAVIRERKRLATYPPPLDDAYNICTNHNMCCRVWRDVWLKTIARSIIHPRDEIPLKECTGLIERTVFPGMLEHCKVAAITKIILCGNFNAEMVLHGSATAKVLGMHGFAVDD